MTFQLTASPRGLCKAFWTGFLGFAALGWLLSVAQAGNPSLTFACATNNGLYVALKQGGRQYPRFAEVRAAFVNARPGSAVLVLADNYPQQTTRLTAGDFELAKEKHLRVYVEYAG